MNYFYKVASTRLLMLFRNKLLITGTPQLLYFCRYEAHTQAQSSSLGFTKTRTLSTGNSNQAKLKQSSSRAQAETNFRQTARRAVAHRAIMLPLLKLTRSQSLPGTGLYLYLCKELEQTNLNTVHSIRAIRNRQILQKTITMISTQKSNCI